MPDWKNVVGRGFTPSGFVSFVESIPLGAWNPQHVVLYYAPQSYSGRNRNKTVEDFNRTRARNSAALRLFVTDELISVVGVPDAEPPQEGAIEILGDFDNEPFATPVRENVIAVLAALHSRTGIGPAGIHFVGKNSGTMHRPVKQTLAHSGSAALTFTGK
jgi:hypothetical protein